LAHPVDCTLHGLEINTLFPAVGLIEISLRVIFTFGTDCRAMIFEAMISTARVVTYISMIVQPPVDLILAAAKACLHVAFSFVSFAMVYFVSARFPIISKDYDDGHSHHNPLRIYFHSQAIC
jgi:hypothetical protein